jgi:DNA-directed RNA polymerase specialized sigma24 family protein
VNNNSTAQQAYQQRMPLSDRCLVLLAIYNALPPCGSRAFWQELEAKSTPLEVLVRCIRKSLADSDIAGFDRISEILIKRTQSTNEAWAKRVSQSLHVLDGERYAFMHDLYSDLYERIMRALLDRERAFWEENFSHCMMCERKHAYSALMAREGLAKTDEATARVRIPRMLLVSWERLLEAEDEALLQAQHTHSELQRGVEGSYLFSLVVYLPEELKAVICLLCYEQMTEKEAAASLGVSERTVRNRKQRAAKILFEELQKDGELTHG